MRQAVGWFLGDNDAGTPMWDPATGGGYDGLTPARPQPQPGRRVDPRAHLHPAARPAVVRDGDRTGRPAGPHRCAPDPAPGHRQAVRARRGRGRWRAPGRSALIDRIAAARRRGDRPAAARTRWHRFADRHRDLDRTFQHHYDLVRPPASRRRRPVPAAPPAGRRLLQPRVRGRGRGAVQPVDGGRTPTSPGWRPAQLRVAISLRQIGEGHLSSIGFATAVLGPGDRSGRRRPRRAR